jgi:signal peptidase I
VLDGPDGGTVKRAAIFVPATAGLLIVLACASLIVLRIWFVAVHIVPQAGMYPTIPRGSVVFGWKRPYQSVSDVKRGDVVAFQRFDGARRYLYIWRVIGLPGDRVEALGAELAVNGTSVPRSLARHESECSIYTEHLGEATYEIAIATQPKHQPPRVATTVGPDELFVMGDNRYDALDSRYFGSIPFASVLEKKL